jgi:hypothetical protein
MMFESVVERPMLIQIEIFDNRICMQPQDHATKISRTLLEGENVREGYCTTGSADYDDDDDDDDESLLPKTMVGTQHHIARSDAMICASRSIIHRKPSSGVGSGHHSGGKHHYHIISDKKKNQSFLPPLSSSLFCYTTSIY